MNRVIAFFAAMLAVGCISHSYTATSSNTYPPKPADCTFRLQSTAPSPSEYEELGTLGGCSRTYDFGDYSDQIREQVCQVGGDLVVGEVNGYGVYCRGVVFKKL